MSREHIGLEEADELAEGHIPTAMQLIFLSALAFTVSDSNVGDDAANWRLWKALEILAPIVGYEINVPEKYRSVFDG